MRDECIAVSLLCITTRNYSCTRVKIRQFDHSVTRFILLDPFRVLWNTNTNSQSINNLIPLWTYIDQHLIIIWHSVFYIDKNASFKILIMYHWGLNNWVYRIISLRSSVQYVDIVTKYRYEITRNWHMLKWILFGFCPLEPPSIYYYHIVDIYFR